MTGGDEPSSEREPRADAGRRPRREFLGAVGAALAGGIAGCAGTDDGGPADDGTTADGDPAGGGTDEGDGTGEEDGTDAGTTDGPTADDDRTTAGGDGTDDATTGDDGDGTTDGTEATTPGELDLREANVTGVEVEPRNGEYRFSVTLYHDDDGEDGYANWWQVETLEGDRLGRRDLLHAHGTREFTRSATIEIPDGEPVVAVRGHDGTHGYGGQAAVVDVESGEVDFVRQGSEPSDLPERP